MNKKEYIEKNIDELFKYWLGQAAAIGSVVFILLSGLDYISTPENFRTFLSYRLMISAFLAALSIISKKHRDYSVVFHEVLAYLGIVGSAFTIELMILKFGGHVSEYYVGMILLCTCVVGFLPGRLRFYVTVTVIIYCIYFLPILLTEEITDFRRFFTSNAFMVFIFGTLLLVKYFSERRLVTELGLMYDLEQHKQNLEALVEQRTTDLSGAIRRLQEEIDERQRIDKELAAVNEQLRQSQKMEAVGLLAGGIAHDFRNMLLTISGCGYILHKRLKGGDDHQKYVDQILTTTKRANDLTQSLLAFSKGQIMDTRYIDINRVIIKTADLLKRIIGEDIELSLELSDRNLSVYADSGQIEQVIMNLATNARDAMPSGGALNIETDIIDMNGETIKRQGFGIPGTYVLVTVADTGTGIDISLKERIFEPFFTTKEFGRGSGLGLSIAYGIITQHSGYMTVDSEPGRGARFRIYLPLAEGEPEDMKAHTLLPPKRGSETILIAEDDTDVRALTGDVLREAGYTVIEASDGEEALSLFNNNSDNIDFVLLDVIMPKKSGKDVYNEIKKIRPGSKVLFISGYVADTLTQDEIDKERLYFISKAADPDDLLRKIRHILDLKD